MPTSPPNSRRGKRINWPAAKAEYVNNAALTYADIAAKYRATPAAVQQRGYNEEWTAAREARNKILSEKVAEKSILDTAGEIAKYNEQDLIAAKALRALAGRLMQNGSALGPNDLRSLSAAIVNAQRVARLALGASTENSTVREENVFDFSEFSDSELESLIGRALRARAASRTAAPETKPN